MSILLLLFTSFLFANEVEIRGRDILVDGKKFIVKGICLSGHIPKDPKKIHEFINKLKYANVNTIRTWGPMNEKFMESLEKEDIKVIFGLGNTWNKLTGEEEVKKIVKRARKFHNIILWCIGNETFSNNFSVPRQHLQKINEIVKSLDKRPTVFANHMVIHAPFLKDNILSLARGFYPIDFTDVIGWNAYPLRLALSWTNLVIDVWYKPNKEFLEYLIPSNLLTFIELLIDSYEAGIKKLPPEYFEVVDDYEWLLLQYIEHSKELNKPCLLTEFGECSENILKKTIKIINKYKSEISGYCYYSWRFEAQPNIEVLKDFYSSQ